MTKSGKSDIIDREYLCNDNTLLLQKIGRKYIVYEASPQMGIQPEYHTPEGGTNLKKARLIFATICIQSLADNYPN